MDDRLRKAMIAAGICAFAANVSCSPKPTKHIVIDDWWSLEYAQNSAKGACPSPALVDKCVSEARKDIRQYEAEIKKAFASDRTCRGIEVDVYTGPSQKSPPAVKMDLGYWALMVDFIDNDQPRQSWSLVGKVPSIFASDDNPRGIAHRACHAINNA